MRTRTLTLEPPSPGSWCHEAVLVKGRLAVWIAVPVLVVMVGFLGVLAISDPSGTEQRSSPLLGRQAPDISGETIDGDTFDLADHRGEFVLLNVFATWCVPCLREHPELVNFSQRHDLAGDATVVSVVFDDTVSNVRDFFDERGGDWPVLTDETGRISLSYGVSQVPESFLISPDGVVVARLTLGVTASGLDQLLIDAQRGAQ